MALQNVVIDGELDYSFDSFSRIVEENKKEDEKEEKKRRGRGAKPKISEETRQFVDYCIMRLLSRYSVNTSIFVNPSKRRNVPSIIEEVPLQYKTKQCQTCIDTGRRCGNCTTNDWNIHRVIINESLKSLEERGFIKILDAGRARRALLVNGQSLKTYLSRVDYTPPSKVYLRKAI